MIAFSILSRAGAAAASLFLCGFLLALPSTTDEPAVMNAAAAVLAATTPSGPVAGEAPTTLPGAAAPTRTARASAARPPGTAGMVVGIDPETGELGMPTPEQLQKISDSRQNLVDHSPAGLVEVHHADGSVSIDLQGRFQEYETVRVGPDGKLTYRCVDGEENAERAVAAPAPAAPEER